MHKKYPPRFHAIVSLLLMLSACVTIVTDDSGEPSINQSTKAAQTVQALLSDLDDNNGTPNPLCNYILQTVDVNYPPNTQVAPGAQITKTWQLTNGGTCTWTPEYHVALVDKQTFAVQTFYPFNQTVMPGQIATVSVNINAPQTAGTHHFVFMLVDDQGRIFGEEVNTYIPFFAVLNVSGEVQAQAQEEEQNKDAVFDTQPQVKPCLLLGQVVDITLPDGTQMQPGETKIKTWQLTNKGTCTWTPDYAIVLKSGDPLGAPATPIKINATVPPEGTVRVSFPVLAPPSPGTYYGYWMMQDATSTRFGGGENADAPFWVKIVVPGAAPAQEDKTSLSFNVSFPNPVMNLGTKSCPYTITLEGQVTANKTVNEGFYFWCEETKTKNILLNQGAFTANQPKTLWAKIDLQDSVNHTYYLCNDTVQRCYGTISVNLQCQQKFAITSFQWDKSKYTVYSTTSSFSVYPSPSITSNGAGYVDYRIGATGSSLSFCTTLGGVGRIEFDSAQTILFGSTYPVKFTGPCVGQLYFYAIYPDGTEKVWYAPLEAFLK